MTIPNAQNLYSQGGGTRPESVEVPFTSSRPPTQSDNLYPIGKRWIDRSANKTYELTSFTNVQGVLQANWEQTGGFGTGIREIVLEPSDTPVDPNATDQIFFNNGNGVALTTPSDNNIEWSMNSPFTGSFTFQGPGGPTSEFVQVTDTVGGTITLQCNSGGANLYVSSTIQPAALRLGSVQTETLIVFSPHSEETDQPYYFISTLGVPSILQIGGGDAGQTLMQFLAYTTIPIVNIPDLLYIGNLAPIASTAALSIEKNSINGTVSAVIANAAVTGSSSNAVLGITVGAPAGGNAYVVYEVYGGAVWAHGIWNVGDGGAGQWVLSNNGNVASTTNHVISADVSTGAITFDNAYTFPTTDGSAGQVLTTNGSGAVSWGPNAVPSGGIAGSAYTSTSTVINVNGVYPISAVPTITGGTSILSLSYTPTSASNSLLVSFSASGSSVNASGVFLAHGFFLNGATNAVYTVADQWGLGAAGGHGCTTGFFKIPLSSGSAQTIEWRAGVDANNAYFNGDGGGAPIYGAGGTACTFMIQEIQA